MRPHPLDSTASWQITDGMTVHGMDGEKLGTVRNYDPQVDYLDVQKGWLFHKDFYVPTTAVTAMDRDGVSLSLTKQDLADDRYATPPIALATEKEPLRAVEYDDVTTPHTGENNPVY
jgi:hypothetical protein